MTQANKVPITTLTNYSNLIDKLIERESLREAYGIGERSASVVRVPVKGRDYWYLQRTLNGKRIRTYIGPDTEETRNRTQAIKDAVRHVSDETPVVDDLIKMLGATGVLKLSKDESALIHRLAEAGVFQSGGILVGTMAFRLYPFFTGYALQSRAPYMTLDIDLSIDRSVSVFIDSNRIDPEEIRRRIALIPKPSLEERGQTYPFAVKGTDLTLDILTNLDPAEPSPEAVKPAFGIGFMAKPLEFMDYLVRDPIRAALPVGKGILLNIPSPERYAVHKIAVAGKRRDELKRRKDILQSESLVNVLPEHILDEAVRLFIRDSTDHERSEEALSKGLTLFSEPFKDRIGRIVLPERGLKQGL